MLRPFFCIALLFAAACTQEPAVVELKGHNAYTRNGISNVAANNYSSYQPAAGGSSIAFQTQSSAAVQSIGVSDLTPPASAPAPAASKSVWGSTVAAKPSAATDIKPQPVASSGVNPWTRQPRGAAASAALDDSFHLSPKGKTAPAKEQMVSEVSTPVKLDNIVSGESDVAISKKPHKAEASAGGLMWPVNSRKILSEFGPKGKGKINDGVNIASAEGEPVWAAADGEVLYVGNELQGYGNMVLIKHNGNKTTTYAHLNRFTVDKYDRVKQGDIIGYVGNSGNVKEPQLHFAVREGKDPVDPLKLVKRDVASR